MESISQEALDGDRVRLTLCCRATGRGAETRFALAEGDPSVRVSGQSRSGNHWTEEVVLSAGASVGVIDISNTGKHNCGYIKAGGGWTPADQSGGCAVCEGQVALREKALQEMQALESISRDDWEQAHCRADEILCRRLRELGETELVEVFERVTGYA